MKVYVVMSRDSGLIKVCKNSEDAERLKQEQIKFEEMGGGFPSVFIVETALY
jgi:hypothetical protein